MTSGETLADVDADVDWNGLVSRALHDDDRLVSVFQPIVDVRRSRVVGYEALTRFTDPDAPRVGPDRWFAEAAAMGVGAELQARALREAFSHRSSMPKNCFLTVNVDPESLLEPAVRDELASQPVLKGVVVEFTEHHLWDWNLIESSVQMLRSAGALIAIDDAGSGHSGLQQILRLRPSILKLDRSLIESIDRDEAKASLVEMMGVFAGRVDAWILAEGVETAAEATRIADLDVPLAQGYFFGRPAPPWADLEPAAASTLRDVVYHGESLHALVDPVAPIRENDDAIRDWIDSDEPVRAVVDGDGRPCGLVDADALMAGSIVQTLVVNVNTTPHDVAQRLSTFVGDPHVPVIVIDDNGRYLGLLGLRRLLHHVGRTG